MSETIPQVIDLPEDEATAYRDRQDEPGLRESAVEKPLSRHQLEPSVEMLSSEEVSAIAAGRIDSMLLDLEANPAKAGELFEERKKEIETALRIVTTTMPDIRKGLSPSGVIAERIEKTKSAIEEYSGSPEERTAKQRLAALELAEAVLDEVYWEPSRKFVDVTSWLQERGKLTDELYIDHRQTINLNTRQDHNKLVKENERNRSILEQKKQVASKQTRS